MENIYKVKIRSNLDPRDLYPSERRYSSSIILGFSVMFLVLAFTSGLMGTLVIEKITTNTTTMSPNDGGGDNNNNTTNFSVFDTTNSRLLAKVETDLSYQRLTFNFINKPALVSTGCFLMTFGLILAGLTGILAWKQWYIDQNITWFFLSSCLSIVTSSLSFLIVGISILEYHQDKRHSSTISISLNINILITTILSVIWSIVATRVSFRGMSNNYPDDIVLSKGRGRIEINTITKGNKRMITNILPPDILNNHFPKSGKFAKYLPKKERHDHLPKEESHREYEERVKKFLSDQDEI